jgi:aminopeptidase N
MKKLLTLFIVLFFCTNVFAQENAMTSCADRKLHSNHSPVVAAKSTNAIPEEDYYDIKHVAFDLKLTDTSIFVQGNVKTTAKVIVPSMSVYVFELDSALVIDSIILNGTTQLPFTTLGFVRTATLPAALTQNTTFNIRVYYSGTPPTGTGFFTGILHDYAAGTHMVYTVSDPYATKDWWPAKQSLQDKIDSVDMHVTVPDYCKVGSNGLLQATVPAGAGHLQYQWKTKYPIDYYLISLAIADYAEQKYYMHFSNSTDSMLIQNFFYDSTNFSTLYGANFDSVAFMVDYFSDLFGRYPFWKEKYGHCFTTLGGGMEHQTMTTIGVTDTRTIAHELCHQWFGDNVTYNQWEDVWMSEGFATYAEQLFIEHWWGTPAMKAYRTTQYNNVMSQVGGRVIVDDSTSILALFDPRLVYRKGAAVAHMLRYMAPQDSLFFVGLREFQSQHQYGMATTTDLKNIMAATYGMNLDTFFNQWVYGEGYPRYNNVEWSQAGPEVVVRFNQTTSKPVSIPLFYTPLEIKLKSPFGDTIVRVYNNQANEEYHFNFYNWMNGIEIDPNNHILDKVVGTIVNVAEVANKKYSIAPNPTKDQWLLKDMEPGVELSLTDVSGRAIWTGTSQKGNTIIPAQQLSAGTYILKIGDINKGTIQLVRL